MSPAGRRTGSYS